MRAQSAARAHANKAAIMFNVVFFLLVRGAKNIWFGSALTDRRFVAVDLYVAAHRLYYINIMCQMNARVCTFCAMGRHGGHSCAVLPFIPNVLCKLSSKQHYD